MTKKLPSFWSTEKVTWTFGPELDLHVSEGRDPVVQSKSDPLPSRTNDRQVTGNLPLTTSGKMTSISPQTTQCFHRRLYRSHYRRDLWVWTGNISTSLVEYQLYVFTSSVPISKDPTHSYLYGPFTDLQYNSVQDLPYYLFFFTVWTAILYPNWRTRIWETRVQRNYSYYHYYYYYINEN